MTPDRLHKKAVEAFQNKPFSEAIDAVIAVVLKEAAKTSLKYADKPGQIFYTEEGYRAAKYTSSVIAVDIMAMKKRKLRDE